MQPSARVGVTVTFLRMETRGPAPRPLPRDCSLIAVPGCTVAFYRYLYGTVGAEYVWWLRRSLSDETLAAILASPAVSIHVLYRGGQPAGFFELDRSGAPVVNLSYFGLMPHATGCGLGGPFLGAAVEAAWQAGAQAITVNTCTADHRRALPGYLRAGFQRLRAVNEVWDVPTRLGLAIPQHLRL